ncbi:transposase [Burkholderia thailandensis]|uniref:transposase n=1 Tax=Burkholderia thailandensis TaxID=57975 RepID=UPI003AAD69FB
MGDANVFRSGREFAAWIGLIPRQIGSGGKVRLPGIGKRGDTHLRKLLIHGARSVLLRSKAHHASPSPGAARIARASARRLVTEATLVASSSASPTACDVRRHARPAMGRRLPGEPRRSTAFAAALSAIARELGFASAAAHRQQSSRRSARSRCFARRDR